MKSTSPKPPSPAPRRRESVADTCFSERFVRAARAEVGAVAPDAVGSNFAELVRWTANASSAELSALLPAHKVDDDFDGPISAVRGPEELVIIDALFYSHAAQICGAARSVLQRKCPYSRLWDLEEHLIDAVSDCYRKLALFTTRGEYGSFAAYICKVARNCAHDVCRGLMKGWPKKVPGGAHRRGKFDPVVASTTEEWIAKLSKFDGDLAPHQIAVRRAILEYSREGVQQYRATTVFLMRFVEGMSRPEVAMDLGIDQHMVRELEDEAREGLRMRLGSG